MGATVTQGTFDGRHITRAYVPSGHPRGDELVPGVDIFAELERGSSIYLGDAKGIQAQIRRVPVGGVSRMVAFLDEAILDRAPEYSDGHLADSAPYLGNPYWFEAYTHVNSAPSRACLVVDIDRPPTPDTPVAHAPNALFLTVVDQTGKVDIIRVEASKVLVELTETDPVAAELPFWKHSRQFRDSIDDLHPLREVEGDVTQAGEAWKVAQLAEIGGVPSIAAAVAALRDHGTADIPAAQAVPDMWV